MTILTYLNDGSWIERVNVTVPLIALDTITPSNIVTLQRPGRLLFAMTQWGDLSKSVNSSPIDPVGPTNLTNSGTFGRAITQVFANAIMRDGIPPLNSDIQIILFMRK